MQYKVSICHENCIHIYHQTPVLERVRLMTFWLARSTCMPHTVCSTIHCYCTQALLRLSVVVVVLLCGSLMC